jgi:hypothetical protein
MIDTQGLSLMAQLARRLRTVAPGLQQKHAEWCWRRDALPTPFQSIADRLRRHGIAMTDVDTLGMRQDFDALVTATTSLIENNGAPGSQWLGKADPSGYCHMYSLRGAAAWEVTRSDAQARIALNPRVLQIVNDYLQCYARLNHYDVWLNTPNPGEPTGSQLWHRDDGTHSMVKMYVLLNDVTIQNGAFVYVLGSHPGGPLSAIEVPSVHDGRTLRSEDDATRGTAPDAEWFTAGGPPGTVILADTRGYHKGGYVRAGWRVQLTSFYTRRDYYRPPRVIFRRSGLLHRCVSQRWALR